MPTAGYGFLSVPDSSMSDQFELPLGEDRSATQSNKPVRTFLGWNSPLLPLAVEHLTRDWTNGTLDLSHLLVVVPTKQTGRRLRSSLALRAATRDAAVLPPTVVTPDVLLSPACLPGLTRAVATRAEVMLAWAEALLDARLDDFQHVFPIKPEERNLAWALRTADDLIAVQSLLGEAGLSMQGAAEIMAAEGLEPQRWSELSRLEGMADRLLSKRERMHPRAARSRAVREGELAPHIEAIVVLGVPDPPPLFCRALEHYLGTLPCEIVIHAPGSLAGKFDDLGRPRPDYWTDCPIPIPDLEKSVHQAINPHLQAEYVSELLSASCPDNLPAVAAIGVPDPELLLPLEKALAARGQTTFNPAGERVSSQPLANFLRTLHQLTVSDSFLVFLDLLRIPGVARQVCDWEAHEDRPDFDPATMLAELDNFQRQHVPESLATADQVNGSCERPNPALSRALSWIQTWLRRLDRERIWETLPELLGQIYAEADFHPGNHVDDAFEATTRLLHEILDSLENGLLTNLGVASSFPDRLRLILHLFEQESIYPEHKAEALDLQGWLELPWEDAPHLVVAGMNDGFVPDSLQGHAYLPDGARRLLGLRHNEIRHARDAYILSSLLACREDCGRVDLIFGRRSMTEEPLRPSRLLFACPPEELAGRVQTLFHKQPAPADSPAWSLSWQLTPPAPDEGMRIFERLSVTIIRDYLRCPFRFYLRRGLEMEREDGPLVELDARHFGTLCHLVVEKYADHPIRDSDREEDISEFFQDTLETIITREYGTSLPVPILVQRESARQRLKWWATIEAGQRRDGWEIMESERPLDSPEAPWVFNGIRITGKIDRIERHATEGTLRVLDFKTGQLKTPREAHLRNLRRHENASELPPWMIVPGSKIKRWTDLQLPLYLLALQSRGHSGPMITGYANLGRAKSEVALQLWEDLDESLLSAAQDCVEGVTEAITARQFWPPATRVDYDDFATMLLGDPEQSINPVHLRNPGQPAKSEHP